jgi:hypothetical protein
VTYRPHIPQDLNGQDFRPDRSRDQIAPPTDLLGFDAAQALIAQVFAVSLNLAGCTRLVTGPAGDRLSEAIADLDRLIVDLRHAAGRQSGSSATTMAQLDDGITASKASYLSQLHP